MYAVYDQLETKVVESGFKDKPSAKKLRQKLNADYYDNEQFIELRLIGKGMRYVVCRDAEHYNGFSELEPSFTVSKKKKEKEKSNDAVEVVAEDADKSEKPKKQKKKREKKVD